jgi:predicted transposase/invertase (TIGR01784 family)
VLNNGDYALVEMQVMRENHWDRRALAYVSSFYGNQLAKGGNWKDLRKVIGINILGGDIHSRVPWPDTPHHFMRHYKFEDQLNGKGRFIDGIELFQYSIVNSPIGANQGLSDWMMFLRNAHNMTEEDVLAEIKTPEVLEAFDRAKISMLPAGVRTAIEDQDTNFERYSQQTEDLILGAKLEGKLEAKLEAELEAAEKMVQLGVALDVIQACTGLSLADIEGIKRKGCCFRRLEPSKNSNPRKMCDQQRCSSSTQ